MTTMMALENLAKRAFLVEVQDDLQHRISKRLVDSRFFGMTEPMLQVRCVTTSDIEYVFVIALTALDHSRTEVSIAQYDYKGTTVLHDHTAKHLTATLSPVDVAARLAEICRY